MRNNVTTCEVHIMRTNLLLLISHQSNSKCPSYSTLARYQLTWVLVIEMSHHIRHLWNSVCPTDLIYGGQKPVPKRAWSRDSATRAAQGILPRPIVCGGSSYLFIKPCSPLFPGTRPDHVSVSQAARLVIKLSHVPSLCLFLFEGDPERHVVKTRS